MTAKEFLKSQGCNCTTQNNEVFFSDVTEKDLIEFAKYHVEKALKEASEKANLYLHNSGWKHSSDIKTVKCYNYDASINKESILNAYPTNLIK